MTQRHEKHANQFFPSRIAITRRNRSRHATANRKLSGATQTLSIEPLESRFCLSNCTPVECSDWMADLPDSVRLSEISIPGTHDTLTEYMNKVGLAFTSFAVAIEATDTQDMKLDEQLQKGIRFWDIRLTKVFNQFHGHHGIIDLNVKFDTVLKEAVTFLTAHPEETILMRVNTEESPGVGGVFNKSDVALLTDYFEENDAQRFLYVGGDTINATLGDVRGKMVLFSDNWEQSGVYRNRDIKAPDFNSADENDIMSIMRNHLSDDVDPSTADTFYRMGMTGESFPTKTPRAVALKVNPLAAKYFSNDLGLRTVGIVTMDFPENSPSLIPGIIQQNDFGLTRLQVNAGGAAIPVGGKLWKSDANATAHHNHQSSNTSPVISQIDMTHPSLPAGTPMEVFQTERWDPSGGDDMQWSFPVKPGDYAVRLYFVENFLPRPRARVFDVEIEGQQFPHLNDIDIFARAGKSNRGIVETVFVNVRDDTLDIDFHHVNDNPQISGIEFFRRPANDDFANAATIAANQSVVVDITGATREVNEPGHGFRELPNTVWYKWTAPTSGEAFVSATGFNFDFAFVAVYAGSSVNSLSEVVSLKSVYQPEGFIARAGTTYQIVVFGSPDPPFGQTGSMQLTFIGQNNDNFVHAAAITPGQFIEINITEMTREFSEPLHAGNPSEKTAWYTWTAPSTAIARITTTGSDFDTILAVYTGSSLNNLSPLVFNDDVQPGVITSELTFGTQAVTTYHIALAGYSAFAGNADLMLSFPFDAGVGVFATREAGDANGDDLFDQLDIVQVLQTGKYLTRASAKFEEGDWNDDDVFDQLDIAAALATGNYLLGPPEFEFDFGFELDLGEG